jgi:hypothetical protein
LCRLNGGTTFFTTTDNNGREVIREKDANALLHDDKLKELFGEDDMLFLKFLLVEKAGMNLRNSVAHAFMLPSDYTIGTMYLLILALLRLGKFTVRGEPDGGKAARAEAEPPSGG